MKILLTTENGLSADLVKLVAAYTDDAIDHIEIDATDVSYGGGSLVLIHMQGEFRESICITPSIQIQWAKDEESAPVTGHDSNIPEINQFFWKAD